MYLKNSQARRDLPTPATPETSTRRAEWRSAEAWKSSLTRRSSWSRPMKGASRTPERCEPATAATTRVAWKRRTGSALPLSSCSPAST